VWKEDGNSTQGTNSRNSTKGTNSAEGKRGPKADPWFVDWYTNGNIAKQTAVKLWTSFKAETQQADVTPGSKEGAALQEAFRAWCMAEETARQDAAAKAKAEAETKAMLTARNERKLNLLAVVAEIERLDGQSAVFDALREHWPELTIIVRGS
jgi:hypothetical protein